MKTVFALLPWIWASIAWSQDPVDDPYVNPATLLPPGGAPTIPKDDLDRKIDRSYCKRPPDWSWVTAELRPVILERLLAEKADAAKSGAIDPEAEERLIAFGHAETIKEVLDREITNPHLQLPQLSHASDEALPFVMPLMMNGSAISGDGYRGGWNSQREHFAHLALMFIRNGHFPPETLKWAERMTLNSGAKGTNERIELLKEWWRQNEAAITANRPMEATWLPPLFRGEPSYASAEELAERRAEVERRRERMKSGREAKEKSPDSSSDGPREHSDKGRLIGWTGGAIGILIALVMFLKKRKSSSRH